MIVNAKNHTFPVNADLPAYSRVVVSGGNLALAGAADNAIGTLESEVVAANVDVAPVVPSNLPGSRKMVAADAIAKYGEFEKAAGGKIQAQSGGTAEGIVLEASTADGDEITVLPYGNIT